MFNSHLSAPNYPLTSIPMHPAQQALEQQAIAQQAIAQQALEQQAIAQQAIAQQAMVEHAMAQEAMVQQAMTQQALEQQEYDDSDVMRGGISYITCNVIDIGIIEDEEEYKCQKDMFDKEAINLHNIFFKKLFWPLPKGVKLGDLLILKNSREGTELMLKIIAIKKMNNMDNIKVPDYREFSDYCAICMFASN